MTDVTFGPACGPVGDREELTCPSRVPCRPVPTCATCAMRRSAAAGRASSRRSRSRSSRVAREHGFRSWPRLKFHVEALTLDAAERAAALIDSVTSADLRRARALLDADPALARHDLACACATGEADEVSRRLAARPAAVSEPTGPNGWEPILYACFSRLLRGDPERAPGIREVVRRLLAAGADPNASFIHDGEWLQVALYGAAGIAGDPELTRMLLEAGADPTDERDGYHGNEVLYHACEFPDPTCAMLVIDAGARQDLVDYDLGRALNFPNSGDGRDVLHARRAGVGGQPAPGRLAPAAAADRRRAARRRRADRRARRARPHRAAGRRPLGRGGGRRAASRARRRRGGRHRRGPRHRRATSPARERRLPAGSRRRCSTRW